MIEKWVSCGLHNDRAGATAEEELISELAKLFSMDSSKTRKFDHFDNSNTMFGSPLSLVTTEQFPYLLE